ncbi:fatty acyl CoA synthetase [Xylella taiwanensis]|uniref:Fatty acyl CoA synthetase n=1 Tax=Xylella taiwanensis TaxID=1444770 RepID=A0ABS8TRU4_9GAMM|nr:LolA-related protein [Xylella taiwanensis]MCD8455418.1 fatty acyl CoA synthetase [Xylella taiwanensis]MCD8457822.1 fatty acyl CoA synthetase [Xylella taiwanensis]MCD8459958.1 fatty acyl CoA synthetase [Xylella taiwanensis]MCD8463981.1 fatty acyl CoA synthetase [Xylella taiwanensis]MCD8464463.1 fatty acyl CoA synthetase [Xylella taiwanensis]
MRRALPWMLILLCSGAPLLLTAANEQDDVTWILKTLAHPVSVSIPFLELHRSALLKTRLRVQGYYRWLDAQTLVREVTVPYHEVTTLRNGEVILERDGKARRRFDLSRAPELAALYTGLSALLSGNRALLERNFRVRAEGTQDVWQLHLAPLEATLAQQVREVRLYGRGADLNCMESVPARGDVQRTLLAGAVQAVTAVDNTTTLVALCHGRST